MATHIITPKNQQQRHWTLAEVFLSDGTHVSLVEELAFFLVRESHPQREASSQKFSITTEEPTARATLPDHPGALALRHLRYEDALRYFQQRVQTPGVRYPSPTPAHKIEGQWLVQVLPNRRGSPYLALALASASPGTWALLENGQCWCLKKPGNYLNTLAQQLRGYGRLSLRLDEPQLTVLEIGAGNRWIRQLGDLPCHLRHAA